MTSCEEAVAAGEIEGVGLERIAADFGTPCYVYDAAQLQAACAQVLALAAPLQARVCYAVKANGNLSLLHLIRDAGLGFDVSSAVELQRVAQAGAKPADVIMTGPGKSAVDLKAAVEAGVAEIVCDSAGELARLETIASEAGRKVAAGVRLNPAIDAPSHPHLATGRGEAKFGVGADEAAKMFSRIAASSVLETGSLSCHIGSQIATSEPYIELAKVMLAFAERLDKEKCPPARLDLGGGFGIGDAKERPAATPLAGVAAWLAEHGAGRSYGFQPGRSVVGRCGILLARVEYRKDRHLIVDAGMTELLRPCLYGAVHGVAHVGSKPAPAGALDVVGPVCENADFLAQGVALDAGPGDLVAVFDCGAYASAMASGYNGRLRACEVLVKDGVARLIRARESFADSIRAEDGAFDWL
ncbi:MAG: diaminopimelate decarboxylase [Betaproteobacteria bacterium AqS2]|uniref:Diaminopimelate decarboxylase n=1 Tax=Candidatus Amphirhobacter heronislandensis TaxID=1732024 RepID=A0A930UI04_9GAMM|nr:diaminopimelate decarboxylase [Betaproteobacteria bacterium AqS2]